MKSEVTELPRQEGGCYDIDDCVGKITLIAENDSDAQLLSMLNRVLFDRHVCTLKGNQDRLFFWLENHVLYLRTP